MENIKSMDNKRKYVALSTGAVKLSSAGSFLIASITTVPIQIASVTVEDYQQGFHEGADGKQDFKDISFD